MNRSVAAGVAGCGFVLAAVAAPYVLVPDTGSGLPLYYGAGPAGGHAVTALALVQVVVLLAGERGGAAPSTAAGVGVTVGTAMFLLAVAWAVAVPDEVVFSFPAAWMGWHRWVVVALSGTVAAASGTYARGAVG